MSVLDGLRVLDLSQGAAGPTAAAVLGDHGAIVTKVEPQHGDWGRTLGPPFWHGTAVAAVAMNRNKRSLALDLRRRDAQDVVGRIVERSDVLIESFRPGVMARLGLDYEVARRLNPRLIYCSITAFGPSGPRRDEPGVDGIAQAVGGLMSITGVEGGERVKVGLPAADMTAAQQAVRGVLLALLARAESGRGQHVEVSLFDSLLALQLIPLSTYLEMGVVPGTTGSGAAYSTPNEAYRTSDGAVMIAAYTSDRWPALCQAIGRDDLTEDARFATNADRLAHRADLRAELERTLTARSTDAWLAVLRAADIMCGPVVEYDRLVADPQVAENRMIVELHHRLGTVRTVGVPIKLSDTPGAAREPAPLIGEHSRELLTEYGFTDAEISTLMHDGAVLLTRTRSPTTWRTNAMTVTDLDSGLRVASADHIAVLTLDRPDAGNSLAPATVTALERAWRDLAGDDDVWVVIVTGAGERFFCTGTDLKLTPPPAESFAATVLNGRGVRLAPPTTFTKPVIAAINGMAVGGGLELALACDLRIAADTAQFGLSEVKLGSLAGQGGTQRLPRSIPHAVAMKMLLTGERIDAAEALRVGLVSDIYPPSRLREEAFDLAERICRAAPLSVRAAKLAAARGAGLPLEAALELENQLWGSPARHRRPRRGSHGVRREASTPVASTITAIRGNRAIPRQSDVLLAASGLVGLAVLVELLPRLGLVDSGELPPTSTMVTTLASAFGTQEFWLALEDTVRGWAAGLVVAVAAGIATGLVIGSVPLLNRITHSTVEFLRPIPAVALVPLTVLVFGTDMRATLVLVIYGVQMSTR